MKKALVIVGLLILTGALISMFLFHPARRKVAMLLVNGVVHTVNDRNTVAEAIAIDGNRIAAVGSSGELLKRFAPETTIDLKGKAVFPGFIDSHAHLEGLGAALMNLNVSGARSAEEVAVKVAAAARDTVHGGWIRGRGWDQNLWVRKEFPTHQVLDRLTPDIPVILRRVDGHAVWVNRKVLAMAGITARTPDPEGGKIIHDGQGQPTGVFVDKAVGVLESILPPPTHQERTEAFRKAVLRCISEGLTEVHDMGVDGEGIEIYKTLIKEGRFPFRVYVALEGSVPGLWEQYRKSGPVKAGYEDRLRVRAIKLYADGALGSRGAALFESYTDDPGNRGLTLTSKGNLSKVASEAAESGFQVCVHAIGDRANSIVLDVYEDLFKSNKINAETARFRVEHAQVLAPDDILRFGKLHVLPMMQPTHCTSDMPWAEARLGPVRVKGAYAWRSLLEHGSIIPGGSDFPVESPNPLWGFYAAITREDQRGEPQGGWYPSQKMTREEALRAFTIWGAYAAFQENEKGSIEPGKWADLVVLSQDIMTIEPKAILETSVEMTLVGGAIVYNRQALNK